MKSSWYTPTVSEAISTALWLALLKQAKPLKNVWLAKCGRKHTYASRTYVIMAASPGPILADLWLDSQPNMKAELSFYKKKIVSHPIPSSDHIEPFIGNVENLWVYYCSAQKSNYVSNRFFCNSSLRNRVIGYQMYKFDIKGFLHWGFNFYYKRLSKGLIDPFTVSDAGKEFPSGDSYIVYPAKDGTAYHSIRLKVFYDALQDMAALKTLEKLTDKKTCLDIIEEKGKHNLTFSNYPHDESWLLRTREAVNSAIKENI